MAPPSATETHSAQPPNIIDGSPKKETMTTGAIQKPSSEASWTLMSGSTMGPPQFDDRHEEREYMKGRLALAFRIFSQNGFDRGVAGHITLRDPVEPTSFWVNPFGVPWKRMRASDLIRINAKGDIVDGGPVRLLNAAAYAIHHAVHTARPDVNCVAHAHSTYGQAFCALGRNLDMATIDSCAYYNDIALYASNSLVVLEDEEGNQIAKALGGRKAALLQNHGLLTCAKTVEAAIYWFVHLDNCCHVQLLADAAAGGRGAETTRVSEDDAARTFKVIGTEFGGWFAGKPMFENLEYDSGDHYKS